MNIPPGWAAPCRLEAAEWRAPHHRHPRPDHPSMLQRHHCRQTSPSCAISKVDKQEAVGLLLQHKLCTGTLCDELLELVKVYYFCRKFLAELVRLAESSCEEVSDGVMHQLTQLLIKPTMVKRPLQPCSLEATFVEEDY